jgi:hypothetical protein
VKVHAHPCTACKYLRTFHAKLAHCTHRHAHGTHCHAHFTMPLNTNSPSDSTLHLFQSLGQILLRSFPQWPIIVKIQNQSFLLIGFRNDMKMDMINMLIGYFEAGWYNHEI